MVEDFKKLQNRQSKGMFNKREIKRGKYKQFNRKRIIQGER